LNWKDEDMAESFEKLKAAALENNKLYFPDYTSNQKLILSTDASQEGAGAELMQYQIMNEELTPCTISLASMAFNKAQKNYSAIERN